MTDYLEMGLVESRSLGTKGLCPEEVVSQFQSETLVVLCLTLSRWMCSSRGQNRGNSEFLGLLDIDYNYSSTTFEG
jgi:hypothetical protein